MKTITNNVRKTGLVIASFLLLSFEAAAMAGIFGSNTLFSEVEGVVTNDGNPVPNARIEQKLYMATSEELGANTETDENGRFTFEEMSESKGLLGFLQQNSESEGKPFVLVCDLSKAPEEDDKYSGICSRSARKRITFDSD